MGGTQTRLEGYWDQAKGKIRETWGDLTDDEIEQSQGKWDQLVGKIKEKTGESVEAVERKLNDMLDKLDDDYAA